MHSWTITAIDDSITALHQGPAPELAQAWASAVIAVMDGLAAGEFDRCAITVDDGPPALLIAGRSEDGHLDLPDASAAVQRLAVGASGWPFV
jgi:hypothetical protein